MIGQQNTNNSELNPIYTRSYAMTQTAEIAKDQKGKKLLSFTLGANDFTIFSANDRKYIVAQGAVTQVIEDPELVARILAKYPSQN